MKPLPRSPIEPFSTMVSLTASALGGTAAAHGPAQQKNARSPSLLARLERWLWKIRQRELERALASATDVTDVEARLRARERALLQRYY